MMGRGVRAEVLGYIRGVVLSRTESEFVVENENTPVNIF